MRNLYKNIVEALTEGREAFVGEDLEPISTIDLYANQPEVPSAFEFTYPAVFVDYKIEWERGGSSRKAGMVTVSLHILTHPMPGTENWNPQMDKGLDRLLYYQIIQDLIEGVSSDMVGDLYAIAEEPVQTDYGTYHSIVFDAPIVRFKSPINQTR